MKRLFVFALKPSVMHTKIRKHKSLLISFIIFSCLLSTHTMSLSADEHEEVAFKQLSDDIYLLNEIEINTKERTVSIPCLVNMETGLIEVVLCRPEGKTHESLLVTATSPLEFNTAMLLLGLDPVNEIPDDPDKADPLSNFLTIETPGDSVLVFLETEIDGQQVRKPVEYFILDTRTNTHLETSTWLYRGAVTFYTGHVIIDHEVSMVVTYHDPVALMELNDEVKFTDEFFYVNESLGLVRGQKANIIIQSVN